MTIRSKYPNIILAPIHLTVIIIGVFNLILQKDEFYISNKPFMGL